MKKLIMTVLALLLVLPILPSKAAGFSDVDLYEDEISWLAERGVIKGYPDGTFRPEEPINRLNAIQLILRDIGFTEEQIIKYSAKDPGFTDLRKGMYGYQEALIAHSLGFISGNKNENGELVFNAGAPINRSQIAKVLKNAYVIQAGGMGEPVTFKDTENLNRDLQSNVATLALAEITTGYQDGTFRPFENTSRQHFAVFMKRTFDYIDHPLIKTQVHFFGDDEGNAAVIEFVGESVALVDAGLGAAELDEQLTTLGLTTIETFIATELSGETLNGVTKDLFEKYNVQRAVDASDVTGTAYTELLEELDIERVRAVYDEPLVGSNETSNLFVEHMKDNMMVLDLGNGTVSIMLANSATTEMYNEAADFYFPFDVMQASRKVKVSDSTLNRIDPAHAILPSNYPVEFFRHLNRNDVYVYSPQDQYITTLSMTDGYYFFEQHALNVVE
ncbi:S-layer homology domain-containing protein [Jeotgalibacillus salarius]|nr:S-layer homology domain-containing protein [Jeotgalibacillus salarius]